MHFILGSLSPRRREILEYYRLSFQQIGSQFDEASVSFNGNPQEYVSAISEGKAALLTTLYPEKPILTADTAVYLSGKIYGKPLHAEDAIQTLGELAGKWHSVFTSVTLKLASECHTRVEETRVLFNPLTPEEIKLYYEQLHLDDKAGAYQMQMAGGVVVKRIEGCYYNVIGLPINSVRMLLKKVGIDLWNCLKQS